MHVRRSGINLNNACASLLCLVSELSVAKMYSMLDQNNNEIKDTHDQQVKNVVLRRLKKKKWHKYNLTENKRPSHFCFIPECSQSKSVPSNTHSAGHAQQVVYRLVFL